MQHRRFRQFRFNGHADLFERQWLFEILPRAQGLGFLHRIGFGKTADDDGFLAGTDGDDARTGLTWPQTWFMY